MTRAEDMQETIWNNGLINSIFIYCMFSAMKLIAAVDFDRKFNLNISLYGAPPLFAEDIVRFVIVVIPSLLLYPQFSSTTCAA